MTDTNNAMQPAGPQQSTALAPAQLGTSETLLHAVIEAARDPSVDPDKMERLFAMSERIQAKQSEELFNAAMNRAQAKMKRIATDKKNSQTNSMYATYGALDRELRPIFTEEGFALSFNTALDAPADTVRVLCYVSHEAGHTRTYHADMPADGKGARGGDVMTKTHAAGSAMQYGMRYLLKMIFNVAIGVDDDGNGANGPAKVGENPESPAVAKRAHWLRVAEGIEDMPTYETQRTKLMKEYGGTPKNIPNSVKTAFAEAKARVQPKDVE